MQQRTIQTPMFARGTASISGANIALTVRPAEANHGIVFVRTDLAYKPRITANMESVELRGNVIDLKNEFSILYGAESLLSALYGLGIDNVLIEVDGAEVPSMLNGVSSWVFLLQAAGVRELAQKRNTISVSDPMLVRTGTEWVRMFPHDGLRLSFHETEGPAALSLSRSNRVVDFSEAVFVSDLCHANINAETAGYHDEGGNFLNSLAKSNLERHQSHLQLNGRIVRFLALCALSGARVQGLYVKFGQNLESDLEAMKALCESLHGTKDPVSRTSGRKVAFIA